MFQSKWISDLGAATPVADAARRVLTIRLEGVRDCLGYALREPGRDPELVHQLRVATRRASAGLESFADCLPPRVGKTARGLIRNIRRAAGKAARLGRLPGAIGGGCRQVAHGRSIDRGHADRLCAGPSSTGPGGPGGIVPRLPFWLRTLHGRNH